AADGFKANKADWLDGSWSKMHAAKSDDDDARRGATGVPVETLRLIGERITTVPKDFAVHKTIQRFLDSRREALASGAGIDWATGEALAFGSLCLDGHP